MAGHAVFGENLLALGRVITRACGQAGQRPYVIGDGKNLIFLEYAVPAERKHGSLVRLGVTRPRPKLDGMHDLVQRTAPQPFVVVEVGKALRASPPTAVTRRAIVAEHGLAAGARERKQRRVLFDIRE